MKLTVLVENTAGSSLRGEHGLAVLIETPHGMALWDAGQSDLLFWNAAWLGIDLRDVRHIALSHGHYDHTGGLDGILRLAPDATVYAHPGVFAERYSAGSGSGKSRRIGIPSGQDTIMAACRELRMGREPRQILPGAVLTGEIPRRTAFEDTGGRFFLDAALTEPDPIPDDQSLVLETPRGLAVLLGCCHAGIVNTLAFVSERWNSREFALVAGGMHLCNASDERLARTVEALRGYRIRELVPGHCTGWRAVCTLAAAFPDAVRPLTAGWTWTDE